MKPNIPDPGQTDPLQPMLEDFLDMSHPIFPLAGPIGWRRRNGPAWRAEAASRR